MREELLCRRSSSESIVVIALYLYPHAPFLFAIYCLLHRDLRFKPRLSSHPESFAGQS